MKKMSKKERVMRTIQFQETDRIPVYDIIDNDAIREYYSGEKITEENAWRLEYTAVRNALDMTRMLVIPNFYPGHSTDEDGFVYFHDRYTSWIEKRPFDDMKELKEWIEKDIDRKKKWMPDQSYVEAYRKQVLKHKAGIGDDTVIVVESDVGMDDCRRRCGIEFFSYLIVDEPELLSEWLEVSNQMEIRRAKAIADPDLVPIMLTYTDLAYKNGPMFSPEFLRKEFFPRLKRLNNTYQDAGVKCLFHSDGNLMPIMDDLVAADIDGINPMETIAGMSIKEVRQKYGHKIFITGGIDVSQLMVFGSPDEVREVCRKSIDEAGGVGYFLGSTTELHPGVKVENFLAMIEVAHNYYKRN
ncbi:MAG: uroporphyrinogen decarboxylase family protein [Clostridia bacterium]|jgi:hypothetical protein